MSPSSLASSLAMHVFYLSNILSKVQNTENYYRFSLYMRGYPLFLVEQLKALPAIKHYHQLIKLAADNP